MKHTQQQSNDAFDNFLQAVDEAEKRKAEAKKKQAKLTRRMKDQLMADLGLTKVRGAVSGRVYYE